MKFFMLLFFAFGCGNYITPQQWEKARELCEPNGGISEVKAFEDNYDLVHRVDCMNGAVFRGVKIKL